MNQSLAAKTVPKPLQTSPINDHLNPMYASRIIAHILSFCNASRAADFSPSPLLISGNAIQTADNAPAFATKIADFASETTTRLSYDIGRVKVVATTQLTMKYVTLLRNCEPALHEDKIQIFMPATLDEVSFHDDDSRPISDQV